MFMESLNELEKKLKVERPMGILKSVRSYLEIN